jgi:hypothetical protein
MRPLNIGITIGLHTPDESLWVNGIKQNALFLAKVLMASSVGHDVRLLNTTDVAITSALPWDTDVFHTQTLASALDELDVLIELGGQISAEQTAQLKAHGTKIVSYCCGFEYTHLIEHLTSQRTFWRQPPFINQNYDVLWVIPQIANNSLHYLQTLRRCPAQVVPFVWDPMFLEQRASAFAHHGVYQARDGAKRLTVMEPNINVVKTCIYPIMIAEQVYRQAPDAIEFLHVCNAQQWAESNTDFQTLMHQLDIVRDGKASFIGRFDTAQFLAEHTDIVIAHQWDNPLNYFYFDVCWQGYPLIHNAHLCADLGYYYPDNDVSQAVTQLLGALKNHDTHAIDYRNQQRSLLSRYTSSNPALVAQYDTLLSELFDLK